jgi:hypothetical protein
MKDEYSLPVTLHPSSFILPQEGSVVGWQARCKANWGAGGRVEEVRKARPSAGRQPAGLHDAQELVRRPEAQEAVPAARALVGLHKDQGQRQLDRTVTRGPRVVTQAARALRSHHLS